MVGEADGDDFSVADGGVGAEVATVDRALRGNPWRVFKHQAFHAEGVVAGTDEEF